MDEIKMNNALAVKDLKKVYDGKPRTFSGGVKRRRNIACTIAHKSKLIIMDELTVGIDPQSRNRILESIKKLRKNGATIIYATHYMEEIETISDRIIIMNEGKIIAEGTKEELKKEVDDQITYFIKVNDINKLKIVELNKIEGALRIKVSEDSVNISTKKSKNNFNKIISEITKAGCSIEGMTSTETSLETVFLELTGKKLRD